MIYECDSCGKALPPEVMACPRCGEEFEEAVPADAEMPKRGFTAKPSFQAEDSPSQAVSEPFDQLSDRQPAGPPNALRLSALAQRLIPSKAKPVETQVLELSGKGDKKSPPFVVGERWRVEWETIDDDPKYPGVFYINVFTVKDKEQCTSLGGGRGSQKDSSEEYGAGKYFLEASTASNRWTIRVINYG